MPKIRPSRSIMLQALQYRQPKDLTDLIYQTQAQSSPLAVGTQTGLTAGREMLEKKLQNRNELAQLMALGKQAGLEDATLQDLGRRPETRKAAIAALTTKGITEQLKTPQEKNAEALNLMKAQAEIGELERKSQLPSKLTFIGPSKNKGMALFQDEFGNMQEKPIPGGEILPKPTPKPDPEDKIPPASTFQVATYYNRLTEADDVFNSLVKEGFKAEGTSAGIQELLPNIAKSSAKQRQEQAERNFVNANLRRESGAVISPGEFENAIKQYFPRYGDSKETLAQKKRNRAIVIEGFRREAEPVLNKTSKSPRPLISASQKKVGDTVNMGNGVTGTILGFE